MCTYIKNCCAFFTHKYLSQQKRSPYSMSQTTKQKTVLKSVEEKQKPKSKEKPNHKNFVSFLIKTYGSYGSEAMI